jgi:hypothetical protein
MREKSARKVPVKVAKISSKIMILGDHDISSPLRNVLGWHFAEEYKIYVGAVVKKYDARVNLARPFYPKKIKIGKYKGIEKSKKNVTTPRAKVKMMCWDLSYYLVQELVKMRKNMVEIETKVYDKFKNN